MKSTGLVIVSSLLVLVIVSAFSFRTTNSPAPNPGPKGIPDSVWTIINNSCTDCHSTDGSGMAKSKINFDKWDTYSPEKQANKAEDICEQLKKGSMPPNGFRKNNPDRIPSEKEITMICNWAGSVAK
jgi:hypothetical protein